MSLLGGLLLLSIKADPILDIRKKATVHQSFCVCFFHGFKNRTGPADLTGWTANRSSFLFGPVIRLNGDRTGIGPLEPAVQPVNWTNRPVLRERTGRF